MSAARFLQCHASHTFARRRVRQPTLWWRQRFSSKSTSGGNKSKSKRGNRANKESKQPETTSLFTTKEKPAEVSFLVPAAKAVGCAAIFVIGARFARPLTILASQPIILLGGVGSLMAGALRRYGRFSWSASFSGAAFILASLGFSTVLMTDNSNSSMVLSDKSLSVLVKRGLTIIDNRLGSPVHKVGEPCCKITSNIATISFSVSDLFINGKLLDGVIVMQASKGGLFSDLLFPEWVLDEVFLDVDLQRGNDVERIHAWTSNSTLPSPFPSDSSRLDALPSSFLRLKVD